MKCLILRRRTLTVLACALLAAAMFALVNAPAVAAASPPPLHYSTRSVFKERRPEASRFRPGA